MLLENSGVLNQISNKKTNSLWIVVNQNLQKTLLKEVNEKSVSVALKKTSEILQDIDNLLSNSSQENGISIIYY